MPIQNNESEAARGVEVAINSNEPDSNPNLNIKIQLFKEPNPFIFIQNDLYSKRYRISTNYKYLNEQYGLKIQFLRDFNKIENLPKNSLFKVGGGYSMNSIYFTTREYQDLEFRHEPIADTKTGFKVSHYNYGSLKNGDRTVLFIFNKDYEEMGETDTNYSLFFASEKYFLKDFLQKFSN
jgi:hypothetical protein